MEKTEIMPWFLLDLAPMMMDRNIGSSRTPLENLGVKADISSWNEVWEPVVSMTM